MAKIIDWFPKIIFCKIPEIIMLMIPNLVMTQNTIQNDFLFHLFLLYLLSCHLQVQSGWSDACQPPLIRVEPHGGCQVNGPKVAKFLDR